MKTKLDIGNLIVKAEQLTYDDRIGFAEQAEIPVQVFETEEGERYELKLVMSLIQHGELGEWLKPAVC